MIMKKRNLAAILGLGAALLLAGCGSNASEETTAAAEAEATEEAAETEA